MPKCHAATGTLLGTGATSHYRNEERVPDSPTQAGYSVYDQTRRSWAPWRRLILPDGRKSYHMSAGCAQRVDLPDGAVLLPVYFKPEGISAYRTTVLRCSFDGLELAYRGQGDELTFPFDPATIPSALPFGRRQFDARQAGLFEPSLTRFQGRYFLTLRNRHAGYVTSGDDGQRFGTPRPWTFDDGELLGNYNTQQHWVTHSDALFLTYTRRGAKNDHVFRHRAPILIAQVDPVRLCLLRSTERVLVPERGADIGNFAVTNVDNNQTWITVAESMQAQPNTPATPQAYGANNHVNTARIHWSRPNRLVTAKEN